jgi:hypothetical protein
MMVDGFAASSIAVLSGGVGVGIQQPPAVVLGCGLPALHNDEEQSSGMAFGGKKWHAAGHQWH